MNRLLICIIFTCSTILCFGQKSLVSYDDIKYLLHNNLQQADTFLVAKGYIIAKKDNNNNNRKYSLGIEGGTYSNISMRSDGKRLFIEIETNEIDQYNLIRESISQYLNKDALVADIQTYSVKDLGNIYVTINDSVPYNPIKKVYDIQVVGDKHITAYN
jgi:predicted house-cleaning NTP pyrophosphatase (Maf/HAM1 superfamily)